MVGVCKRNLRQIAPSIDAAENTEVIDAAGRMVIPSGIDVHTEFSVPGSVDDFGNGTKAAVFGGTTTVRFFGDDPSRESVPIVSTFESKI